MSDTRLTIGLLTPAWPGHSTPNGIVTSVVNLAAGLQAIGHQPVIIGTQDGTPPKGTAFVAVDDNTWGVTDKIKAKLIGGSAVHNQLQIKEIVKAIRTAHDRHGLDAVIMEETKGWPYHIAPAIPVPLIANLHGPWKLLSRVLGRDLDQEDHKRIALEAKSFARVAGLMAPSQASMLVTQGLAPDTPRALIRNSYPPMPEIDAALHKPGHILFVGRVERLKGADTVLMAFEHLVRTHPQTHLTFVGPERGLLLEDGRNATMDEALAALAPTARDRITYLGARPPSEIAELRKTHPLALIASRFENLNYSMLEAIAAGQAMVSTDVGGPAEILDDGVTASLVPPGDPKAMAIALGRLVAAPATARRLADQALAMLVRDFHPDVVAAETVAFVQKVRAGGQHP